MEVKIQIGNTAYTFTDSLSNLASKGDTKQKNGEMFRSSPRKPVQTCDHSKPILRRYSKKENKKTITHFFKKPFATGEGENQIDKYSRFFFPFSYGVFLLVYFAYFFYP
jgi:hypothetical protein